jgi:hypothetical protein
MTRLLYSAARLRTSVRLGCGLGEFLSLNPQRGAGTGHAGADPDAPFGLDHRGGLASSQAAELDDFGHHAVRGIAVLQARSHQQHVVAVSLRGVDGRPSSVVKLDRHHHAG